MWWDEGGIQQLNFLQTQLIDNISISHKKDTLNESFLRQKYIVDGLSSAEIGALTFSSRSTVTRKLQVYGIPLKNFTRRNNGPMAFGFRKHFGRSIELKKEQTVIDLINDYRKSGYSYQKIADILNQEKIRTKKMRGIWYSKVIRQIFKRCV